ncbi:MAG TPA: glycosyltransferase family 4 protein, partial [Geobacteraceae bacterium]|nr:glycosyltransferase family 4 protein [Geobacteraceae bacterium]
MRNRLSILHLTAHLGGGVGKALSGLVLNTPRDSNIRHAIVCLEKPEKNYFIDKIRSDGCTVTVCPEHKMLQGLIEDADIVQLEWWNHPTTIDTLCKAPLPAMRLIIWCHVSGLYTPIIPTKLLTAAHRCIFTSPCSYESAEVKQLTQEKLSRLDVIHSAGGFDGFVPPARSEDETLAAGYLGSLNFAKLHPHYLDFLTAVPIPDFTVKMIGDMTNKDILRLGCEKAGRKGMLEFVGYTDDVVSELSEINITPYLLNPKHYGTTENALLESMAMGVVPIVLNNPAERCLISDRETGMIVNTPQEFAHAVVWLANNPRERLKISKRAAESVRERFSPRRMVTAFSEHYFASVQVDKSAICFKEIFGETPAEWFLTCQKDKEIFTSEQGLHSVDELTLHNLLERTKGSSLHFHRHFPEDMRLTQWTKRL